MSLANISIVGNLAREPEQFSFQSGKNKTVLVVAVNSPVRGPRDADKAEAADFYRVEMWGKLAELALKYLSKGNQVGASGRLIFNHWSDKNGMKRMTPVIEATQISLPPKLRLMDADKESHSEELVFDDFEQNESRDIENVEELPLKRDPPPKKKVAVRA